METKDILIELSKGSNRRPRVIDDRTFNENWDRIYGKKKKEEKKNDKKEIVIRYLIERARKVALNVGR